MDIILDKNSATEALIKITLKEGDYQPKVEEKVKDYSRKAQIKGFRPGKVPASLIKKMYGKSILLEEINELLSKSVTDYIKENKIKIIGDPLPNTDKSASIDWDNQKDFEFEYNIGLVDVFTIDYAQKIKAFEVEVDEKTINDTVERLKKQYGIYSEPEISGESDDYFGELSLPGGDTREEVWLLNDQLDSGEGKKLAGLKKDETARVDISKLFKESSNLAKALHKTEDEAKNLSGEFEFKLSKASRVEAADINQDFFDKVFGKDVVKSEEEFRVKLKETVQKNYQAEAEHHIDHLIQEKLMENTTINIPDNFFKKWLLTANKGNITEADIEQRYDSYAKELKWSLIFNKIAEDNDIKVEHDEVVENAKSLIRAQFMAYGMADSIDSNIDMFANNYLKGKDGENYLNTYNKVRSERIMKLLREKMEITYKKVSPDNFVKSIEKN